VKVGGAASLKKTSQGSQTRRSGGLGDVAENKPRKDRHTGKNLAALAKRQGLGQRPRPDRACYAVRRGTSGLAKFLDGRRHLAGANEDERYPMSCCELERWLLSLMAGRLER